MSLGVCAAVLLVVICCWLWRSFRTKYVAEVTRTSLDFKTYMENGYMHPCRVLGLPAENPYDRELIKQHFFQLFNAKTHQGAADWELQIICSAFFMPMTPSIPAPNKPPAVDRTVERRASHAEAACAELQSSLIQSERAVELLRSELQTLTAHLSKVEKRAQCAPPSFDAWLSFMRSNCIQGDDMKVGSAELHTAFVSCMAANRLSIQPPSQQDLRILLERLGFDYGQLYLNGGNTRGFRGLGLATALGRGAS